MVKNRMCGDDCGEVLAGSIDTSLTPDRKEKLSD